MPSTVLGDVFERAPAALNLVDANGRVLRVNDAFAELVGSSPAELVGIHVAELIASPDRQAELALMERLRVGELDSITRPGRLRTSDGSELMITAWTTRIDDIGGPVYLTFVEDAMTPGAVEHAAGQRARDAIVVCDEDGVITFWSPGAVRVFGMPAQQMLGTNASAIVPVADRDAYDTVLRRLRSGAEPPFGDATIEVTAVRSDGTEFPVELSLSRSYGGDGTRFVAVIHDISERRAFQRELERLAFEDELTGLPNANRLRPWLDHAATEPGVSTLVLVQLDELSHVTNRLGQDAADRMVQAVAGRLELLATGGVRLARYQVHEFALLCPGPAEMCEGFVDSLFVGLELPVSLGHREVDVSVCVGAATVESEMGHELVLRRTGTAVAEASRSTGRCFAIYSEELDRRALAAFDTEIELRAALERGELEIQLQPEVDLVDGCVTGAEALVRWNHPDRGLLPPSEFLPIAEESGLIVELGRDVLAQSLRTAAAWESDLVISVNVSAAQLADPGFAGEVLGALRTAGCPADRLRLEVTETAVMAAPDVAIAALAEIRESGVGVALDDFGTGHSSLAYLQQLPATHLKIDRGFVSDVVSNRTQRAIVSAVIAMANALDLGVVAEGVDTSAQLAELTRLGTHSAQGFFIAQPMSLAAFDEYGSAPTHRVVPRATTTN